MERCRVFLFPGQSSVGPGVLVRARQAHPAADDVARRARCILGEARTAAWLDPAGARIDSNRDIQVVVFLATQMYLAALEAEGIEAHSSLGLSLGEYSHLVHIGALGFADALRLVDERGSRFDEAPQGTMITALAADLDSVASVVDRAQSHGPVVISNYNAPTQHVISGATPAVEWAAQTLEDEYGAHTTVIERRVPMHSPLMTEVADAFSEALASAPWQAPVRDYWPNVTGVPVPQATPADFLSYLTRHVSEPVQWRASIDALVETHPQATLVEVGPGRVLHNMVGRAWRGVRCARVDGADDSQPHEYFAATLEALRA